MLFSYGFYRFYVFGIFFGIFLGNAERIAGYAQSCLLIIGFYPIYLMSSILKMALMSVIPAAFVATLPIQVVIFGDLKLGLLCIAVAVIFMIAGSLVFYIGLRRYQSGNIMQMKG